MPQRGVPAEDTDHTRRGNEAEWTLQPGLHQVHLAQGIDRRVDVDSTVAAQALTATEIEG